MGNAPAERIAVGIDVAEARKGLDIVVLDQTCRLLVTRRRATIADVIDVVESVAPDVICIDSPPAWASHGRSRTAERELRRLGITAFATPVDPGPHPFYGWMRAGFAVFDAVSATHPRYRGGPPGGTAAEVFPEATAALLAGHLRPAAVGKRDFRRQVLAEHGVDPTPLRSQDAVDAALAALTGVLAVAGECCTVGDPDEGVVMLPVRSLPTARLDRSTGVA
jgi:predicted nuclease with RNAse H fold